MRLDGYPLRSTPCGPSLLRSCVALLEEDGEHATLAQSGEIDQSFQQGFTINIEEAIIESADLKPEGFDDLLLPVRLNRNGRATAKLLAYRCKFLLQFSSLAR